MNEIILQTFQFRENQFVFAQSLAEHNSTEQIMELFARQILTDVTEKAYKEQMKVQKVIDHIGNDTLPKLEQFAANLDDEESEEMNRQGVVCELVV